MINTLNNWILKIKKHQFLFEELVKRDFKKKYKRTILGMLWSLLSPLMTLLVMSIVFTKFFGRNMPHYTIYLFSGNLVFNFFRESTYGGMNSLMSNSNIITKINLPKYIFLLYVPIGFQWVINFPLWQSLIPNSSTIPVNPKYAVTKELEHLLQSKSQFPSNIVATGLCSTNCSAHSATNHIP